MKNIKPWPKPTGRPVDLPKRIRRPADYGLELAIMNLETQLGTIEAYNRLVEWAVHLRKRIDGGDAKAQNPLYAVSPTGE